MMTCFDVDQANELVSAIEKTRVSLFENNEIGWYVDFDEATLESISWVDTDRTTFDNTFAFMTEELLGRNSHAEWLEKWSALLGTLPGRVTTQAEIVLFVGVLEALEDNLPNKYMECPGVSEERLHTVLLNKADVQLAQTPDGTYHLGCDECELSLATDHTCESTGLACGLPVGDCSYTALPDDLGAFITEHSQQFCTECLYVSRWLLYADLVQETPYAKNQQAPHLDHVIESDLEELIVVESDGPGDDHGKVWVFNGQRVFLPDTHFIPDWQELIEAYRNERTHMVAPPTLPNHSESRWKAFLREIVPETELRTESGPRSQVWRDYDSLVDYIREATYLSSTEELITSPSRDHVVYKVDRDGRVFHVHVDSTDIWTEICGTDKSRKRELGNYLTEKGLLNTDGKYAFSKVTTVRGRERTYWDLEIPLVKTDEPDFERLAQ